MRQTVKASKIDNIRLGNSAGESLVITGEITDGPVDDLGREFTVTIGRSWLISLMHTLATDGRTAAAMLREQSSVPGAYRTWDLLTEMLVAYEARRDRYRAVIQSDNYRREMIGTASQVDAWLTEYRDHPGSRTISPLKK